jgi:hypothetical protein
MVLINYYKVCDSFARTKRDIYYRSCAFLEPHSIITQASGRLVSPHRFIFPLLVTLVSGSVRFLTPPTVSGKGRGWCGRVGKSCSKSPCGDVKIAESRVISFKEIYLILCGPEMNSHFTTHRVRVCAHLCVRSSTSVLRCFW